MKQNPEDPNNHVPPIEPGDDWGDLDDSTDRSRVGLPPRRAGNGLPPKKESIAEKVNLKERMEAGEPDVEIPPDETRQEETESDQRSAGKKPSRRKRGKTARKPRPPGGSEPEPEAPPEASHDIPVILPTPKAGIRARVNEIGAGGDKPAPRAAARPSAIPARNPSPEPDADAKEAVHVVQKRRRFMRGERMDWGETEGRGSMRWMLLTGLGVVGVVILAVVLNQRPESERKRSREQSPYSAMALAEDEIAVEAESVGDIDGLLDDRPQAVSILTSYATAKSAEDFIGHVHKPEQNRELIGREWQPMDLKEGWEPSDDAGWYVKEENGIRFAVLEGIYPDFTPFRAFFHQEGEEGLRLDWKATTGYGTADFAELKSGKGDGSEIRVWLSPADFHTFSFPEGEYRSFRIMSPNGDATIWGYVPAGGELEKELLELFRPSLITGESKGEIQVTLSLAPSAGDSLPEQWLITDLARTDWLDK